MKPDIQLLDSHRIDAVKWDACVAGSPNCLIYALTNYLNHTTDNWKGIVVNDYEAVMPIPWRKKLGITYSCHVPFLQQAGLYSVTENILSPPIAVEILRSFCSYGSYHFNFAQRDLPYYKMVNLILPLTPSYEEIEKSFSNSTRDLINSARQKDLNCVSASIEECVDMYAKRGRSVLKISGQQYLNFKTLCNELHRSQQVVAKKIIDNRGETFSVILLLRYKDRLYNIINATSEPGRKINSNYLLYHSIFKEFSNSSKIFDFEGSNHPGIAHFYRKFSPVEQPYYRYNFNDLPFFMKWIRK